MPTETITLTETGCYLDNHRGHYIQRDAILLAAGWGYIVGPFEQWAIDTYDNCNHEEDYPHEAMQDLCDHAVEWLNSGQGTCISCHGSGHEDGEPSHICRGCSGKGRGPRIAGQNFPPIVPANHHWAFNDGDFGLYLFDDEGEIMDEEG